jgi:copper chaperone CopZ
MSTMSITVAGMTCGHCAASVRDEISSIAGVTGVDVDVSSGLVRIYSDHPVDPGAVKGAIEEAGYRLAG